jgi:DNA-binding SARP family transcriptional activator/WD40 repeat protein/tRNA A-37 threonylcarbamoyl transferase component Bud32
MTLEFGVLGPIEVRSGGEVVALGGPQQRRIVATLIAERGHVVAVDRLVDTAWPDDPPDGARRTVMTYVSRLRLALGDGHVVTQDRGYRLATTDEDAIDATRFERLVERARTVPPTQAVTLLDAALALWRGRAYGEFADEWWALPHATRLEELRIVAAEQRAEALVASGADDRAVAELEALVVAHPLRERPVAQLMRAYEASGRQADALRAYARYRDHLADETGLEPSAALRELERSILVGSDDGTDGRRSRSMRGYRLGELLGEGAFGAVYTSTQPGVGREVAIKVIRAELADDPTFVRRFEAEAQLVAHLEHPHIVPLYDFWREPGGAFLVFRLLRGGTALDLVRRDGPGELQRVHRVVTEIGGALAAAHAASVVHRDVKPTNVLFDEAGHAYLADFGIATTSVDHPEAGRPTLVSAGSPLYAAPEQFQLTQTSPQADQYSFAAMIWELLTAVAPFEGPTPSAILRGKLERPVGPLHHHRPDLPRELDHVLQRATASRPEDRYDDVSAFLDAWHAAVHVAAVTVEDVAALANRSGERRADASTDPHLAADFANPYKGLRAFGEADARHFHGRGALVARLDDAVRQHPVVTVVGASGCGKSSLVQAGLMPRLRAAELRVVSMVPGDDPVGQLRIALLAAALDEPDAGGVELMVRSVAAQADGVPLVIVIDQLEELWTLAPDHERTRFARGLASVFSERADDRVRIVATVRADFFDRPLGDPALGPLVAAHPFAVTPMTASELHDAVVAPASALGVVFEPGLDSAIVAEVANHPASLPLLQFTLAELFERRRGRVITREAYESMGGIVGSITSRAEALASTLDAAGQDAARRLLLRLVVPGDETEDTRRRIRHSELPPGTAAMAAQFEAFRLLVADRDPMTREPTVEIAHEALIRSWPRLRGWLSDDRDVIRQIQQVGTAADAWAAAGRPESELYRGARLDAAGAVLDTRPDHFTDVERDFVAASRTAAWAARERDQRARRRLLRGFVATAVALALALIAGAVAFVQRRNADTQAEAANVARLVSLSQSLTGSKRDVAMLLAVEAARRDPGASTTGALEAALYADRSFLGYLRTGQDAVAAIEFGPDGRSLYATPGDLGQQPVRIDLATGQATPVPVPGLDARTGVAWFVPIDGSSAVLARFTDEPDRLSPIERIDLADGHLLGTASIPGGAATLTTSPDRTRAAVTTIGRDGVASRVAILDLATMAVTASIDEPGPAFGEDGEWISSAAWIDDRRLVVGSPSGRMVVWAPETDQVLLTLNDPPAPDAGDAGALRVTPDGSQVVVASVSRPALMAYELATGAPSWPRVVAVNPAIAIDPLGHVVWAQEVGVGSSRMFAYDLATGERGAAVLDGQNGSVCDAEVSADSRSIAVASCNEGTVARWALDGATATGTPLAPAGWATSLEMWSPDGTYVSLFRLDDPDVVEIVDVRDGTRWPAVGVTASAANAPVFRPDGVLQAVVDDSNHVVEVDPTTRATRDTGVVLPGGHVSANVALRTPLSVYGMDDGTVAIVDASHGRVVRTITTDLDAVFGVGWSPDGRQVFAAGQGGEAQVFDVATGAPVATLSGPAANLILSPDGELIATTAFNGTITIHNTRTLEPVGDAVSGGGAFPAQIEFTPDGRTLITSGLDNTLRLFDVASRRQVGVPIAIASWGAAISPDSTEIAITTERGVERLAIDPAALSRAACRAAGRDLTAAEWAQYIGGKQHQLCPD